MKEWIDAFWQVINLFLGAPGSEAQLFCALGLAVLACVLGVCVLGGVFGGANTGLWMSVFIVAGSILLTVLFAAAVKLLVAPELGYRYHVPAWLLIGSGVVGLLLFALPLQCVFQRTNYLNALLVWAISLVAAAVLVLLCQALFSAADAGGKMSDKLKVRKDSQEQL
ncbi:MAG: hypothetical protein JXR37_36525 [Kiritimatiellae bacterium]|nr:hypothetical protein [Kiritimatiellia bacterium]